MKKGDILIRLRRDHGQAIGHENALNKELSIRELYGPNVEAKDVDLDGLVEKVQKSLNLPSKYINKKYYQTREYEGMLFVVPK